MNALSTPGVTRTAREIQDWLIDWIANECWMERTAISVYEHVVNFGLSSRQAILLTGELEDWSGRTLPATLVWDCPTIEKMTAYLRPVGDEVL
jgi:acyl carrier protein